MKKKLIIFSVITLMVMSHVILSLEAHKLETKTNNYKIQIKEIQKIDSETKLYLDYIRKITELKTESQSLQNSIDTLNTDISVIQENIKNYNDQTNYYNLQ